MASPGPRPAARCRPFPSRAAVSLSAVRPAPPPHLRTPPELAVAGAAGHVALEAGGGVEAARGDPVGPKVHRAGPASHPGQTRAGQIHTGQSHTVNYIKVINQTGQTHTGQTHTGQSHTGQLHNGQKLAGSTHTGRAFDYTGHEYTTVQPPRGRRNSGQTNPGQPHTGKTGQTHSGARQRGCLDQGPAGKHGGMVIDQYV